MNEEPLIPFSEDKQLGPIRKIGLDPWYFIKLFPANLYLFKVKNKNTRKRCEICLKLTIKHQNDVIDVNLAFLLLTLNIFPTFSSVSIVDFEQVNVNWDRGKRFHSQKSYHIYCQNMLVFLLYIVCTI